MWAKMITVVCVVLIALVGCGWLTGSKLSEEKVEQSRHVLISVLDAWKTGQAHTLAAQTPPIRFQDDDYMAGWRLVDYQLVNPKQQIQSFRDVPVQVNLIDRQGKPLQKTVTYQVGLDPITVQRSDN
jgi:hypothetical protein